METPQPQHLPAFVLDLLRLLVWLVLLMAIFPAIERRWALHPQRLFRKAFGTDLVYYFVSGIVPKLVLILPMTILAAALHHWAPSIIYERAAAMPLPIRLAAAMVVGEVGAYWGHRWSHEIPLLWRFHAIHHSAEEMDWLVNSRVHPVDLLFTRLCGLIPMYVLGLAQPMGNRVDVVPILVSIAGIVWGFFIHANLNWRLGWLEWLISTPAFHHWHHTNDGPEVINKNYSAMLPWVDRCFGTFYLPRQQWPGKYGIDGTMPASFAEQMLQPLSPPVEEPASFSTSHSS
jgi:sterol desaturase/sphingolipid hydroxylase (fatty acid hydroxylase superfamily)